MQQRMWKWTVFRFFSFADVSSLQKYNSNSTKTKLHVAFVFSIWFSPTVREIRTQLPIKHFLKNPLHRSAGCAASQLLLLTAWLVRMSNRVGWSRVSLLDYTWYEKLSKPDGSNNNNRWFNQGRSLFFIMSWIDFLDTSTLTSGNSSSTVWWVYLLSVCLQFIVYCLPTFGPINWNQDDVWFLQIVGLKGLLILDLFLTCLFLAFLFHFKVSAKAF